MLKSICHADSIVIYWDLPDNYVEGNTYTVTMNGAEIGKTAKCHLSVEELAPETEYVFAVEMAGETFCKIGEEKFSTESVRKFIDVTKPPYNAVGDGKTLNTKSLQAAINDCGKGERVYIPAGDFMTGSLFLHSDMELYLDEGAIIHGTTNVSDYEPKIKSRFEGYEMMCYAALINIGELERGKGYNCRNVKISGKGTVSGGGVELAQNVVDVEMVLMKDYIEGLGEKIKEFELPVTVAGRPRPRLINMSCAQNVEITDITIANGASWNVHMIYSDNIVTYGCTFRSQKVWNGDGWDPDSSTNCTLFGSEFFTGDDAVAIKSGKNPEGNVINIPCEHIRVFDCVSHFGHGITIGSEMSGGVNDVRIWNCDMGTSTYGVEIKGTKKRGGYVRNVRVSHCKVCRLLMHSVGYNDDGEGAPTAPVFEDCSFENIQVTAHMLSRDGISEYCEAIELSGFDIPGHHLKNIRFKNINIDNGADSRRQCIYLQCCDGVTFENISCR